MKGLFIIFFTTLTLSCNYQRQLYQNTKVLKVKHNFIDFEDIAIKITPLTNREYLIFLCWHIDVYGASYPEKIISLLPHKGVIEDATKDNTPEARLNFSNKRYKGDFQAIIEDIEDETFQSYTLNPKYLDFPLIGLSKNQTFELLKWMSDRYNEYSLISRGFMNFNPEQRDEDCWVLESYLSGQYQGDIRKLYFDPKTRKEIPPKWSDMLFVPTFRLPFDSEFEMIKSISEEPFQLKEYEFKKTNLLWIWDDFYIDKKDNYLNLRHSPKLRLPQPLNDLKLGELNLKPGSIDNNCYQDLMYFDDQNSNEKDKFGHRDFLILGETSSNKAITGEFKQFKNGEVPANLISWVVFNKEMTIESVE